MSAEIPDRTASLVAGIRGRARALERAGRSPLCVELLRGAAASAESGGIVASIFDGDRQPPGSVAGLRLLSALHHLVLSGHAPQLAQHYPSAAGRSVGRGRTGVVRRCRDRLALEPGGDGADGFELRCWEAPLEEPLLLAIGGYHGPPVRWSAEPA